MAEERTLVSFDWAIKYLLKNKADYVILEGFLTTLLNKKIKIKSIEDSESRKDSKEDKYNIIDVLAKEEDGSLILIELQFSREIDYFQRMLYGASKAITDYMNEGMPYSKVRKVYSINIVYFDLGVGKDYIYYGSTNFKGLHRKDELELSAAQKENFVKQDVKDIFPEYYILKIDQFRDIVKSKLDEWMYYLKNSKVKPEFKAPGLKEAEKKLWYSSLSLEDKHAYDKLIKIRRSNISSFKNATDEGRFEGLLEGEARGIEKGKAEGLAEGELKAKLEIAKKLKAQGLEEIVIYDVTGLPKGSALKDSSKPRWNVKARGKPT